jgi:hypothetical protein
LGLQASSLLEEEYKSIKKMVAVPEVDKFLFEELVFLKDKKLYNRIRKTK